MQGAYSGRGQYSWEGAILAEGDIRKRGSRESAIFAEGDSKEGSIFPKGDSREGSIFAEGDSREGGIFATIAKRAVFFQGSVAR